MPEENSALSADGGENIARWLALARYAPEIASEIAAREAYRHDQLTKCRGSPRFYIIAVLAADTVIMPAHLSTCQSPANAW